MLRHPNGPFGKHEILDFYIRTEFQFRGSAHVHCVLWLKDVPKYIKDNQQSIRSVSSFIDTIITTEPIDEEMEKLIKLQIHKHSDTCKRFAKGKKICRLVFHSIQCPKLLYWNHSVTESSKIIKWITNQQKVYVQASALTPAFVLKC